MNIFSIDSWDQPRSEVNDSILRCTHGSVSLGLPHIIAFVNQSLSFPLLVLVALQRKATGPRCHPSFLVPRPVIPSTAAFRAFHRHSKQKSMLQTTGTLLNPSSYEMSFRITCLVCTINVIVNPSTIYIHRSSRRP